MSLPSQCNQSTKAGAGDPESCSTRSQSTDQVFSVLVGSKREWVVNVLLPSLLQTQGFRVSDDAIADIAHLALAVKRVSPDLVLVDTALLEQGRYSLGDLGRQMLPRKIVLLMDQLDPEWADAIVAESVSGVLFVGSSGPACSKALRSIGTGDLWLPRWLLCRALLQLRSRWFDRHRTQMQHDRATGLLTAREHEIADLVATGISNKEIANLASISVDTVKKHLRNIYAKYHVHHRSQIVALHRLEDPHIGAYYGVMDSE